MVATWQIPWIEPNRLSGYLTDLALSIHIKTLAIDASDGTVTDRWLYAARCPTPFANHWMKMEGVFIPENKSMNHLHAGVNNDEVLEFRILQPVRIYVFAALTIIWFLKVMHKLFHLLLLHIVFVKPAQNLKDSYYDGHKVNLFRESSSKHVLILGFFTA